VLFWDAAVLRQILAFFVRYPLAAVLLAASLAAAWRFIQGEKPELRGKKSK
ncbi:MAG: hypothetical protein HDT27_07900, partial [Subdoligranulum sp.]|nr:hypothetical protein [Subdoligranulum sp.]